MYPVVAICETVRNKFSNSQFDDDLRCFLYPDGVALAKNLVRFPRNLCRFVLALVVGVNSFCLINTGSEDSSIPEALKTQIISELRQQHVAPVAV